MKTPAEGTPSPGSTPAATAPPPSPIGASGLLPTALWWRWPGALRVDVHTYVHGSSNGWAGDPRGTLRSDSGFSANHGRANLPTAVGLKERTRVILGGFPRVFQGEVLVSAKGISRVFFWPKGGFGWAPPHIVKRAGVRRNWGGVDLEGFLAEICSRKTSIKLETPNQRFVKKTLTHGGGAGPDSRLEASQRPPSQPRSPLAEIY